MTPRRFVVRETREAVQVTAENLAEVAAWCGGQAYVAREGVVVPSAVWYVNERGGRQEGDFADVGDYLVTDGTRWWDVSAEEFERDSAGWEEQG